MSTGERVTTAAGFVLDPSFALPPTRDDLPEPEDDLHDAGPDPIGNRARKQFFALHVCGLTPSSSVLEVGCGVGRLARELGGYLEGGRYLGLDVSVPAISWLQEHYASVLPNFRFERLDVHNPKYRADADTPAEQVRFPCDDGQFDIACSFAVLMHMQLPEISRYLAEIRRALKPEGRAVVTALTVPDPDDVPVLGTGQTFVPIGGGVYARSPDQVDFGLAFDHQVFRTVIEDAGLCILGATAGEWNGTDDRPTLPGGDSFVLRPC